MATAPPRLPGSERLTQQHPRALAPWCSPARGRQLGPRHAGRRGEPGALRVRSGAGRRACVARRAGSGGARCRCSRRRARGFEGPAGLGGGGSVRFRACPRRCRERRLERRRARVPAAAPVPWAPGAAAWRRRCGTAAVPAAPGSRAGSSRASLTAAAGPVRYGRIPSLPGRVPGAGALVLAGRDRSGRGSSGAAAGGAGVGRKRSLRRRERRRAERLRGQVLQVIAQLVHTAGTALRSL